MGLDDLTTGGRLEVQDELPIRGATSEVQFKNASNEDVGAIGISGDNVAIVNQKAGSTLSIAGTETDWADSGTYIQITSESDAWDAWMGVSGGNGWIYFSNINAGSRMRLFTNSNPNRITGTTTNTDNSPYYYTIEGASIILTTRDPANANYGELFYIRSCGHDTGTPNKIRFENSTTGGSGTADEKLIGGNTISFQDASGYGYIMLRNGISRASTSTSSGDRRWEVCGGFNFTLLTETI